LPAVFSLNKFQLISEIRSLTADCLPSRIKVSGAVGVSAIELFDRSVAHFFHSIRITGKNMKVTLVYFLDKYYEEMAFACSFFFE
jgi:hypothetical protein